MFTPGQLIRHCGRAATAHLHPPLTVAAYHLVYHEGQAGGQEACAFPFQVFSSRHDPFPRSQSQERLFRVLTWCAAASVYCVDVSVAVTDQFRDLERPSAMRRKDVVLMATVTSFESMPHPSRSELRQFAELFGPLYSASSDEARRQAVAALSQCPKVPNAVTFFIASQPIAIAAPFLTSSPCLDDDTLIAVARTQGAAHVRAIVRRENLSPKVVDALVSLRHDLPVTGPQEKAEHHSEPASPSAAAAQEAERRWREDELRQRIKALASHVHRSSDDRLGLRTLSPIQDALLVRFARNREGAMFAAVLADSLSASHWLAERIMLDISGQQLATTLKALGMEETEALYVLQRFYSHLDHETNGVTRGQFLWNSLHADECGRRLEAWRRADSYTTRESEFAEPAAGTDGEAATVSLGAGRILRSRG